MEISEDKRKHAQYTIIILYVKDSNKEAIHKRCLIIKQSKHKALFIDRFCYCCYTLLLTVFYVKIIEEN